MRRSQRRMLQTTVGAWLCWAGLDGSVALAQAPSPAPNSPPRPVVAPGTWTVAVVTSTTDPASKALLQALRSHPWVVANADRVKLGEVSSDATGRPVASGSTAVLVYQQGARGPEMMGGRSGFTGVDDVVLWVRGVVAPAAEAMIRDPNLAQANLGNKSLPSAQAEPPQYQQQYQPAQPQAQMPSYLPQPQTTTTFAVPATMVQAPQQHLVIQQPPTQVLFAPQAAPMVYVPQAAAPTANLFLPPPAASPMAAPPMMVAAPAPPPMMTASPSYAPQATIPVGPALAGAALTTSSFSVPASSTTSRIKVKGPGPIASALSRFGERLTTLGRTRIETVQETRLETQTTQTPPGQYMTLSATSASPVLTPQQATPSAVPQPLPPLPPAPPSPQASPQAGQGRWH